MSTPLEGTIIGRGDVFTTTNLQDNSTTVYVALHVRDDSLECVRVGSCSEEGLCNIPESIEKVILSAQRYVDHSPDMMVRFTNSNTQIITRVEYYRNTSIKDNNFPPEIKHRIPDFLTFVSCGTDP